MTYYICTCDHPGTWYEPTCRCCTRSPEKAATQHGPPPIQDALTSLRQPKLTTAEWRIQKIAQMHEKYVDSQGGTYGECNECGHTWPCPTYAWATTAREYVLDAWDPADDEGNGDD